MNVIVSNKYQTLLSNLNIDVIKTINGVFSVDEISVQFRNFFFNKMILDITALEDYENVNTIQKLSVALDMSKVILLLDDSPKVNSAQYLSQIVSMGIYNFTKNVDKIAFLMDNPNTYKDVASFHHLTSMPQQEQSSGRGGLFGGKQKQDMEDFGTQVFGQKIIGVRNLTEHAGSTTLCYLLKKHLESMYKVIAVEIEDHDFMFFNDSGLDSCSLIELKTYIQRHSDAEVILVDLKAKDGEELCSDVIYLVEPGLIQLNRLIREDNAIFEKLKGRKLILNRSVLTDSDISDFERESGSKIFANIPNVDDKVDNNKVIKQFLLKLGFTRFNGGEKSSGFNLFK